MNTTTTTKATETENYRAVLADGTILRASDYVDACFAILHKKGAHVEIDCGDGWHFIATPLQQSR